MKNVLIFMLIMLHYILLAQQNGNVKIGGYLYSKPISQQGNEIMYCSDNTDVLVIGLYKPDNNYYKIQVNDKVGLMFRSAVKIALNDNVSEPVVQTVSKKKEVIDVNNQLTRGSRKRSITSSENSLIDEKNGFKTIKIGADITTFPNLSYIKSIEGLKIYSYVPADNNLYYVFNKKYDSFLLYFDTKGKLAMIMIKKVFTNSGAYSDAMSFTNDTRDKFNTVLGQWNEITKDDSRGNLSFEWYGSKIFYSIGLINFDTTSHVESNVVIGKTEKLEDGF